MEEIKNNQSIVELPITTIHYDPVNRQIVTKIPDSHILVDRLIPEYFDCSYVYVPAWRG